MLTIIPCTLIFCAWLWYEKQKHSRQAQLESRQFWEQEEAANHTRNKDTSDIRFITLEPSQIPTSENPTEPIRQCILQINNLLENPIADLSEYTNTELKLRYGVGNFSKLAEYDTNYTNLSCALSNLAKCYFEEHDLARAEDVYHLLFEIGSHKATDYEGLAKVYLAQDKPEKVSSLIQTVKQMELPRKESILKILKAVLASYS